MQVNRFHTSQLSAMFSATFRGNDPKKPEEMDWIKIYSRERDDEVALERYHRQKEENAALQPQGVNAAHPKAEPTQQNMSQQSATTTKSNMPTDPKELQQWLWEQYNIFNRDR